jgi:two-component system, LytTR family, response regulator
MPLVIFVTAYDEHAVAAFEFHALDYLLKPVTQARLRQAVERARQRLSAREAASKNQQLLQWLQSTPAAPGYLGRIAVKNGRQTLFVRVEDIVYLESAANYAVLHTAAGNHVVRETLAHLETKLPPDHFFRISRSVMVNLRRVKALHSAPEGDCAVILENDIRLPATRGIREISQRLQYR